MPPKKETKEKPAKGDEGELAATRNGKPQARSLTVANSPAEEVRLMHT
jgi:hypothetical protein